MLHLQLAIAKQFFVSGLLASLGTLTLGLPAIADTVSPQIQSPLSDIPLTQNIDLTDPYSTDLEQVFQTDFAVIQSVQLSEDGRQLVINSDRPVTAEGGWDLATTDYRIVIPNARLAPDPGRIFFEDDSDLLEIRLRQEEPDTVVIFVKPAAQVWITGVYPMNDQQLLVQWRSPEQPTPIPPITSIGENPGDIVFPEVPDSRIVVVIDPGHGGRDPGAVGIGGLQEVQVIFPISLEVAALLEQEGIQVVLTRSDDREVDLAPRVQIAERANADLFVSIHANAISMSRPDVNGVETYFYASTQGRRLAEFLQTSMLQASGMRDRGVKQARFYVLANTSMPAALVEVGFVTGVDDAPRLADPEFRSLMARAIVRGILQYVQQTF